MPDAALVLVAAWLWDRLLGEPPNALHPVVWIGNTTRALMSLAPQRGRVAQWLFGTCVALTVPAAFGFAAYALLRSLSPWHAPQLAVSAYLLKSSFSLDGLRKAGRDMQAALGRTLPEARAALRSLCSRDASTLAEPQLVGATVESLAENASDSVVAPLLYYALFGVPGAIAYRAINTLDAMIGYHGRYEYLGKTAARVDDLFNLVPARLTALALLLGGAARRENAQRGLQILLRDRNKTESPNAGWPMAAMAGLLGVQLDKEGAYSLGDAHGTLASTTIDRCWHVVSTACWLFAAALAALLFLNTP